MQHLQVSFVYTVETLPSGHPIKACLQAGRVTLVLGLPYSTVFHMPGGVTLPLGQLNVLGSHMHCKENGQTREGLLQLL